LEFVFVYKLFISIPHIRSRLILVDRMVEGAGSVEASIVFEKLFNDYLGKRAEEGKLALYMKKLEALKKDLPILEGIYVDKSANVTLDLRSWDTQTIVRDMSFTYDSLIDIASFTEGPQKAFVDACASVEDIRKQFESSFDRLKIAHQILRGSLRKFAPTGVDGMDKLISGGIPVNHMVLLLGPPGNEKYQFAFQFLANGLAEGGAGLVTVSSMSVKDIRKRLKNLKINAPSCETKGTLKIVDWYSQKSKPIVGLEEKGSVLIPSKDIANLDIALMVSMDNMEFAPTKRAIIDVITSALGAYNISEVTEFVQRQKMRLKRKNTTTLLIVEEGAHDDRVLSTLKHISDGVIVIKKDQESGLSVQVESMEGIRFDPRICSAQSSKKGLAVVEGGVDESGVIDEFSTIPGLDKEVARNLVDAGYTDMEKLNTASKGELRQVKGVDNDIATKILDYMGSVEYSQRVLANKSEKWLKRGTEQLAANEIEKAKMSFNRALEIFYGNTSAWLELSRLYFGEGDEEESRKCYDYAVSFDPKASAPWLGIDAKGHRVECRDCGFIIENDTPNCPTCGVTLSIEDRKKLRGD